VFHVVAFVSTILLELIDDPADVNRSAGLRAVVVDAGRRLGRGGLLVDGVVDGPAGRRDDVRGRSGVVQRHGGGAEPVVDVELFSRQSTIGGIELY